MLLAYAILAAAWLTISWRRTSTPPGTRTDTLCVDCGYDLSGLVATGAPCPECGKIDPHLHPIKGRKAFDLIPARTWYLLAVTFAESLGLAGLIVVHHELLRRAMIRQGYTPFAVDRWIECDNTLGHFLRWPPFPTLMTLVVALSAAAPWAALSRRRWWIGGTLLLAAAIVALIDARLHG